MTNGHYQTNITAKAFPLPQKVSVWPQYSCDRPTLHALCVDILKEAVTGLCARYN